MRLHHGLFLVLFFSVGVATAADEVPPACQKVKDVAFPKADEATASAALKGCDSEALYYGIGEAADVVKARQCAFIERASKAEQVFGGSGILMMIYANGKGTARNLDLALRMACEYGGAPAEIDGRIEHLEKMKTEPGKDLDICDDITSGYMGGFCTAHEERLNQIKRSAKLAAIIAKWPAPQQEAFKALQAAAEKFFESRSGNEIDLSGTARASFQIAEKAKLQDELAAAIGRFEKGRLPQFSAAQFKAADAALNATYHKVQGHQGDDWGTVKPENIKTTQREWISYRDAWVAFGQSKYPAVTVDSWKTWLTKRRTQMLKEFAG